MIINVLADVRVEEVVKILVEMFIINVRAEVLIDMFSGVSVDVLIVVVTSDIDFVEEVLTDANANVFVAAMTASWFTMSSP